MSEGSSSSAAAHFTETPLPLAIVGLGKIARDQHLPAIARSPDFELAATVTLDGGTDGVPDFPDVAAMAAALPHVRAIAVCTPPRGRQAIVAAAFAAGLDVLIEKPPAATLGEAEAMAALAAAHGRVLYTAWHSREAAAVAPARDWLAARRIERVSVSWKEDVRVWHPGQEWIWSPGIGVFDPGINALSILTAILPGPLTMTEAALRFPAGRQAPIAADLSLVTGTGAPIACAFDFDQRGAQSWRITLETDAGTLVLDDGAATARLDGVPLTIAPAEEYDGVYRRFAATLARGESDVDLAPLRLVADAFMLGTRDTVAAFDWEA